MARGRAGEATKAAMKALTKAEKDAAKDAKKVEKEAQKIAIKEVKAGRPATGGSAEAAMWDAARTKRLLGVATTVAPLLAPYALSAVSSIRGRWDARRAERLGVPTDQLTAFSGPGGALHARLSHLAESLTELEAKPGVEDKAVVTAFVEQTRPRLSDLSVAVRAAEQMPSGRRRTAFRSISTELDGIELTLLDHLGVTT